MHFPTFVAASASTALQCTCLDPFEVIADRSATASAALKPITIAGPFSPDPSGPYLIGPFAVWHLDHSCQADLTIGSQPVTSPFGSGLDQSTVDLANPVPPFVL